MGWARLTQCQAAKNKMGQLIEFTNKGLYCPQGQFYLDPWKPVDKALITHAHGDHAHWGSKSYLSHHHSLPILKLRLGEQNHYEGIGYGEPVMINGVKVSFHPAGHIVGSAQIRLEHKGEVWVFSGDYKLQDDGLSTPFEPVKCNTFITESTFGLPIYNWAPQTEIYDDLNQWRAKNAARGFASLLFGYSLGKAQRLLMGLDLTIGPVYLHGSVWQINQRLIDAGHPLPPCPQVDLKLKKADYRNATIIAPPSAMASPWARRFLPYATAMASGWMQVRGNKRRRAADKGLVLSDHADWQELNKAVKETGAECIYVTHGYTQTFSHWLREQGLDARIVKTQYEGERNDTADDDTASEEITIIKETNQDV